VLVLDVSPPALGPIEAVTRLAAHMVATSLLSAQLPQVLITLGGRGTVAIVNQRTDLIELWTRRSPELADPKRGLTQAIGMARTLQDSPVQPVILLLSHAWLGADQDDLPEAPNLRALFVQYPGYDITPPLAERCERWESVPAGETEGLEWVLGRLLG
jgi:hypothetical protein